MMDEHFMRGLKWLGRAFRGWVDLVTPTHAPGEDTYFTRIAAACRPAKRAVAARAPHRRTTTRR